MDCFFFQAEDGIRDLVRSRGLGDVYKRQEGPEEAHLQDDRRVQPLAVGDPEDRLQRRATEGLSLIHI